MAGLRPSCARVESFLLGLPVRRCIARGTPFCPSRRIKKPTFDGPLPPTKPPTPFLLFLWDQRYVMERMGQTMSYTQLLKESGAKWRLLPSSKKEIYMVMYQKKKIDYEATLREFEEQFGGKDQLLKYQQSLDEYRKKKKEYAEYLRLKMGSNCNTKICRIEGYKLFVSDKCEKLPEDERQPFFQNNHWAEWDALSFTKRQEYISRAAEVSRLVLLEKFPDTEKCPDDKDTETKDSNWATADRLTSEDRQHPAVNEQHPVANEQRAVVDDPYFRVHEPWREDTPIGEVWERAPLSSW